ncbi:pilin glycosylation aminotransferase PglC [Amylibacter marinus]|uniref:Pilin glycosylation aminotransferase PglC n=1 Tax=Amylibacter marinus TaxID=1475483 RepID=A0ABQ5VY05_9RHOB|nr:DegT/DnrJ/EryC1/StrS aminotransferase family protein [Amylibacter marinus]GLQ35966.1 pilin glycosylation aminotransferase PglC [Amylibacter marinus]
MLNGPFSPWPSFTDEEANAVSQILLSNKVNYWTGTQGREFEKEFAEFAGANHAIAVANGTLALDLALQGLGIGARNGGQASDEVIVTPRSFMASVSAVVSAGAIPVFADIDADSQNITPHTVAPHITTSTRAILCVHLGGWPCDMLGFKQLVTGRDIKLIEDCAQAHGAKIGDTPVGALGDVGAWSFCQDKIITTGGEGGMVTCNDPALWKRMWAHKDHGKSWDAVYEKQHPPGYRWVIEDFGTNWRLAEMQSAIGRIQLRRLAEWQDARQKNAKRLESTLAEFAHATGPVRITPTPSGITHAFYRFCAFVRPENLGKDWTRDRIVDAISTAGVPCFQGTCSELYREAAFDSTGWRPTQPLETTKKLGDTCLTFLVHPTLTQAEMDKSCRVIQTILAQATG